MVEVAALLSKEEMAALIEALSPVAIYQTGRVVAAGEERVEVGFFLDAYQRYLETFEGLLPYALSVTPDAFTTKELDGDRRLVVVKEPVVQLQPHTIAYSKVDQKFRSMVRGPDAISWGYQFSYPLHTQDPETRAVQRVDQSFPNTPLFRTLQRWIRHHTAPTPMVAEGKQANLPARLGKECFGWINEHPQLREQGLCVSKSSPSATSS